MSLVPSDGAAGGRELVEALRRGENRAWAVFVERYLRLVHHVVRKTLAMYGRGNEQDVEDVTHDLFQSLVRDQYRALGTIGEPYDVGAWLAVSARRRAIDFVRKRRLAAVSLDEPSGGEGGRRADPAAPVEEVEGPAGGGDAMAEALGELSSRERLVVRLFYLKGKKYREIARLTGMNMNSIGPTLLRAVEKMRQRMAERDRSER